LNRLGYAENLANVDVAAFLIDLRVILAEDGKVQSMVGRNLEAVVSGRDDVSLFAILLGLQGKAELASNAKVGAVRLVFSLVGNSELVSGHIVSLRDLVTVIPSLDGVSPGAVRGSDGRLSRESKDGDSEQLGEHDCGWVRRV